MSIEALYPSRSQPRSANPLFLRERRRRQRIALVTVAGALASLVALDLLPAPQERLIEGRSAAVSVTPEPSAAATAQKPVRVIPF